MNFKNFRSKIIVRFSKCIYRIVNASAALWRPLKEYWLSIMRVYAKVPLIDTSITNIVLYIFFYFLLKADHILARSSQTVVRGQLVTRQLSESGPRSLLSILCNDAAFAVFDFAF